MTKETFEEARRLILEIESLEEHLPKIKDKEKQFIEIKMAISSGHSGFSVRSDLYDMEELRKIFIQKAEYKLASLKQKLDNL